MKNKEKKQVNDFFFIYFFKMIFFGLLLNFFFFFFLFFYWLKKNGFFWTFLDFKKIFFSCFDFCILIIVRESLFLSGLNMGIARKFREGEGCSTLAQMFLEHFLRSVLFGQKKSRILETKHLLTDVDSSTATKKHLSIF